MPLIQVIHKEINGRILKIKDLHEILREKSKFIVNSGSGRSPERRMESGRHESKASALPGIELTRDLQKYICKHDDRPGTRAEAKRPEGQ